MNIRRDFTRSRRLLSVSLVFLFLVFGATSCAPKTVPPSGSICADDLTWTVVRVIDGDSVLLASGSLELSCRLEGIDAPELSQPFGIPARNYLECLLSEQSVTAHFRGRDSYNRVLARLGTPSAADISCSMIQAGAAWHYAFFNSDAPLSAAHTAAQTARIGLWSDSEPVEPYLWRQGNR